MLSFRFVFVLCVLTVSIENDVSSEEEQKIQAATYPDLLDCSAKFGVPTDHIKKAKESGTLSTIDPCLMACFFKQGELIDDKGLYDAKKAEQLTNEDSGEADQKKALEIISNCKSVNEHDVTDGEKGCERAALLFECFRPFKDFL